MALIRAFLGAASDPSAGGGLGPNQGLASQLAWFIDGSNVSGLASDGNDGKTLLTPLLTRGQFYLRMNGVTLTSPINVTLMSDILAADKFQSDIFTSFVGALPINWIGSPTTLFSNVVTDYVAESGTQQTQMGIASIPVSWTASGLVGKVIEFDNGAGTVIKSFVIADLGNVLGGHPTALLAPPVNQLSATSVFAVGNTIKVYALGSFGSTFIHETEYSTYKYLNTSWEQGWGRMDCTSCTGNVQQFDGNFIQQNYSSGASVMSLRGTSAFAGGYNSFAASRGTHRVNATGAFGWMRVEAAAVFSSTGADISVYQTNPTIVCVDLDLDGGQALFSGFVYGQSNNANGDFVNFGSVGATVFFKNTPTVAGVTTVLFGLAAKRELLTRLASLPLNDYFNNGVYGSSGPMLQVDRDQIAMIGRGIYAETTHFPANNSLLIGGSAYYVGIGLRAGDIVTNIVIMLISAGVAMTRSRVGLYDKNGNLLVQSADQGASWQTLNLKTIAMTAPFTILTTDYYFIGIIGQGGTLPQLSRGPATSFLSTSIGTGKAMFYIQLGQADLPSPATFADSVNPAIQWWAGIN